MSLPELITHRSSNIKTIKNYAFISWAAKLRIIQSKVKRPSLKESATAACNGCNLFKLCEDILNAHKSSAFGRKPTLWSFMRDILTISLNRRKDGVRFFKNSKTLAHAMKIYEGVTCLH